MNWLDSKLRKYAFWRKWRGIPEPMPFPWGKYAVGQTIKIRKPPRYICKAEIE